MIPWKVHPVNKLFSRHNFIVYNRSIILFEMAKIMQIVGPTIPRSYNSIKPK